MRERNDEGDTAVSRRLTNLPLTLVAARRRYDISHGNQAGRNGDRPMNPSPRYIAVEDVLGYEVEWSHGGHRAAVHLDGGRTWVREIRPAFALRREGAGLMSRLVPTDEVVLVAHEIVAATSAGGHPVEAAIPDHRATYSSVAEWAADLRASLPMLITMMTSGGDE